MNIANLTFFIFLLITIKKKERQREREACLYGNKFSTEIEGKKHVYMA
jgi:hypothetical protein